MERARDRKKEREGERKQKFPREKTFLLKQRQSLSRLIALGKCPKISLSKFVKSTSKCKNEPSHVIICQLIDLLAYKFVDFIICQFLEITMKNTSIVSWTLHGLKSCLRKLNNIYFPSLSSFSFLDHVNQIITFEIGIK